MYRAKIVLTHKTLLSDYKMSRFELEMFYGTMWNQNEGAIRKDKFDD